MSKVGISKREETERMFSDFLGSMALFGRVVCNDLIRSDVPKFHVDICDLVTRSERVALAAPRGFSKSTWVARIYPLYLALFKIRKDICIISASEGLAVEHMRWIKQKVESCPMIKILFGDLKSDKWSESHIIIMHKDGTLVNIRAKGAGGQIRGFRPDCLILDDIETDDLVLSEEQRKKLKAWLFTACINCLLPGGQFIIIGTLIHPLSVLSEMLDMDNGWDKRRWQAYVDGIEQPGHELWAQMRPHEWLQKRKAEIGSFSFASEYMNDPKLDSEAPIKYEYIKVWEELPKQMNIVIAVDPAYSEELKSDFKVAVVIGVDYNNNRYLIDYVRTHCPTGEFIDKILNLYMFHKGQCFSVGVPAGREKEFFDKCVEKAQHRNLTVPFVEVKNTFVASDSSATIRNKKRRIIAALQPLFEQGRYYIHSTHEAAKEELLTIGSSRWDDIVDAMTYAEQLVSRPYFQEGSESFWEEELETISSAGGYGIEY